MKLYDKGYTIKQRFTGVLIVALMPILLMVFVFYGIAQLVTAGAKLSMDWYERLLKSMRKKGGEVA